MANLHDDSTVSSSAAEHQKDVEHPGFLQKIKDKLHISHHHKSHDEGDPSQATTDSGAVSSKSVPAADVSTPPLVKEAEPTVAKPVESAPASVASHEEQHHGHPTTDLNSLVGHEAEHHGGVPTFLVALPDQDIPDEVTQDTAASNVSRQTGARDGGELDSEEVFSKAQQGEHHEGVPTFLVALPDQDIPDEVNKETSSDVSAGPTEEQHHSTQDKDLHSEELFSNAQQGEHHGGVPTFLVALPDQEIPEEVNKGISETDTTVGEKSLSGDSGVEQFDSEEVFSKAQHGEHHEGVPTFLVALPHQDIPDEVTKGIDVTAAPASSDDAALQSSLPK